MINYTCKILRVIAIRTYWAEQLIFGQKWEFQPNTYERIGHSYVLGSNSRRLRFCKFDSLRTRYTGEKVNITKDTYPVVDPYRSLLALPQRAG